MLTTTVERTAALAAIKDRQGDVAAQAFLKQDGDVKDARVFTLEESAATFVSIAGPQVMEKDPILKGVIDAAKAAKRIDPQGNYVGPSTDSDGDDDDEGEVIGGNPVAADDGDVEEFINELEGKVHATAAKDPKTASDSCC